MASNTAPTSPSGAVNVTPVDDAAVALQGSAVTPHNDEAKNVAHRDDLVSMEGGGEEGEGGWEVEEGRGGSEALLLYARDGNLSG